MADRHGLLRDSCGPLTRPVPSIKLRRVDYGQTPPSVEMRIQLISLLALLLGALSVSSSPSFPAATSCTLTASGGDDSPQFLSAVKNCQTVVIPKTTTLSINTRLNMTGLANKHLVRFPILSSGNSSHQTLNSEARALKGLLSSSQTYHTGLGYISSLRDS